MALEHPIILGWSALGYPSLFIMTLEKVSQSPPTPARRRPMIGPWSNTQGDGMIRWLLQSTLCLHSKRYLLIAAICLSCCAINGCVVSIFPLATDSRLPKWLTLPPGLTRADVKVVLEFMESRKVDTKVVLTDRKCKELAEVSGKTIGPILSRRFFIDVVNGIPEIIGFENQIDGHGNSLPYFYVVDDPALKKKLLDENEKKLLDDSGIDYPALRKKLLDENGGPISAH